MDPDLVIEVPPLKRASSTVALNEQPQMLYSSNLRENLEPQISFCDSKRLERPTTLSQGRSTSPVSERANAKIEKQTGKSSL